MALKDDWKETGKGLGEAFAGLGKTLVRSGKTAVDKAVDWAEDDEKKAEEAASEVKEAAEEVKKEVEEAKEEAEKDSNVFNDGSWRETGKGLGQAFAGLGKYILESGKTVVDKITNKDEEKKEEA